MALSEVFGGKLGTTIGVQLRDVSGVTTKSVTGITVFRNNAAAERNAEISFRVDGLDYRLRLEFTDETLESRNLHGAVKEK